MVYWLLCIFVIYRHPGMYRGIIKSLAAMRKTLPEHQRAIELAVTNRFIEMFGIVPEPFKTVWPASCHDRIQTLSMDFDVRLHPTTGKVLSITPEPLN